MRRHKRIRCIAKWASTFFSSLLLLAWLLSIPTIGNSRFEVTRYASTSSCSLLLGTFQWGRYGPLNLGVEPHWDLSWVTRTVAQEVWEATDGTVPEPPGGCWIYGIRLPSWTSASTPGWDTVFILPIWAPLVVILTPTAFLWSRDRRGTDRRPPRVHHYAKWVGATLSLLILAGWITSTFVWFQYVVDPEQPRWSFTIAEGMASLNEASGYHVMKRNGEQLPNWRIQTVSNLLLIPREVRRRDFRLLIRSLGLSWPLLETDFERKISVPFWLPFCTVFAPTVVLFFHTRRYKPGHCQSCGYDLTGNTSGICPECGTAIARGKSTSLPSQM